MVLFGGTVILIRRKFTKNHIRIHTTSIKNTILHIQFNGKELRLGTVYKSPVNKLLNSDLGKLLYTDVITIFAGDLKVKTPIWHSQTINSAGKTIQNYMNNTAIQSSPRTLLPISHFPDIHHLIPDVLDIALVIKQATYNTKSEI